MIEIPAEVRYLLDRLEKSGYEGYLVGGCVRDALLGIVPKDWDLCTCALPEEIVACFFDEKQSLSGFRHGTVGVILNKQLYEITSYRTESGYSDGRHPDTVAFVRDLTQDLARRDFTVNAMAYHPKKGLVDPWNGRKDLAEGVLRCVGDPTLRFQEDFLRILRGLRFAATYGLQLEEETAQAAIACREGLRQISAERIQAELVRLLTERGTGRVIASFWPVFAVLLPECGEDERRWKALSARIDRASNEVSVRLAVLLSDSDEAEAALSRLRLSNKLSDEVKALLRWKEDLSIPLSVSVKYLLRDLGVSLARFWIDYRFALENRENLRCSRIKELERVLSQKECFCAEQLAIGGRELKTLRLSGPRLGECLAYLLDQVIWGKTENAPAALRDEAYRWMENGNC